MQPRLPIFAMLALLMTGCATPISDEPPPADWPKLKRVPFSVAHAEMRQICAPTFPILSIGLACTYIVFRNMTCVTIESKDHPMPASTRKHESQHCDGKDHVGDDKLARGWQEWKAQHQAR